MNDIVFKIERNYFLINALILIMLFLSSIIDVCLCEGISSVFNFKNVKSSCRLIGLLSSLMFFILFIDARGKMNIYGDSAFRNIADWTAISLYMCLFLLFSNTSLKILKEIQFKQIGIILKWFHRLNVPAYLIISVVLFTSKLVFKKRYFF